MSPGGQTPAPTPAPTPATGGSGLSEAERLDVPVMVPPASYASLAANDETFSNVKRQFDEDVVDRDVPTPFVEGVASPPPPFKKSNSPDPARDLVMTTDTD